MVSLHANSSIDASTLPIWLDWELNPFIWAFALTAFFLYTKGLAQSQGTRRRLHPWWKPFSYYTGLLAIVAALLSPIDALAYELFTFHMLQHLLLTLIGAPLVLLGSPMIPILRGIPRKIRMKFVNPALRHIAVRNFLKFLSLPVVAWAIYITSILGWHAPPAYSLALENEIVHDFEHLTFTLSGILFWWNVIDPIPLRSNLSYLGRVPYIFITTIPNFVLGAFITFAASPLYSHYTERNLFFGLTAMEDQQIAGILMWIPGAIILLITLLSILFLATAAEEKNQRHKDSPASPRRS